MTGCVVHYHRHPQRLVQGIAHFERSADDGSCFGTGSEQSQALGQVNYRIPTVRSNATSGGKPEKIRDPYLGFRKRLGDNSQATCSDLRHDETKVEELADTALGWL